MLDIPENAPQILHQTLVPEYSTQQFWECFVLTAILASETLYPELDVDGHIEECFGHTDKQEQIKDFLVSGGFLNAQGRINERGREFDLVDLMLSKNFLGET